jgi:hypothetical protein
LYIWFSLCSRMIKYLYSTVNFSLIARFG